MRQSMQLGEEAYIEVDSAGVACDEEEVDGRVWEWCGCWVVRCGGRYGELFCQYRAAVDGQAATADGNGRCRAGLEGGGCASCGGGVEEGVVGLQGMACARRSVWERGTRV